MRVFVKDAATRSCFVFKWSSLFCCYSKSFYSFLMPSHYFFSPLCFTDLQTDSPKFPPPLWSDSCQHSQLRAQAYTTLMHSCCLLSTHTLALFCWSLFYTIFAEMCKWLYCLKLSWTHVSLAVFCLSALWMAGLNLVQRPFEGSSSRSYSTQSSLHPQTCAHTHTPSSPSPLQTKSCLITFCCFETTHTLG